MHVAFRKVPTSICVSMHMNIVLISVKVKEQYWIKMEFDNFVLFITSFVVFYLVVYVSYMISGVWHLSAVLSTANGEDEGKNISARASE